MKKTLPGWQLKIEEVSNCVYQLSVFNASGNKVERTDAAGSDSDLEELIQKANADAFDLEKQISKNWNKFLFELALQNIDAKLIVKKEYNEQAFGSWYIETKDNCRIVYDGKDFWLIRQLKGNNEWTDHTIVERDNLNYQRFMSVCKA